MTIKLVTDYDDMQQVSELMKLFSDVSGDRHPLLISTAALNFAAKVMTVHGVNNGAQLTALENWATDAAQDLLLKLVRRNYDKVRAHMRQHAKPQETQQ